MRFGAAGLRAGLALGARRGAVGVAEEDIGRGAADRRRLCRRVSARGSRPADGRRATAHWKFGRELAARYPGVRVEHEPLWVKDGNIYTSAGFSAGIDLALAWVEEDCGAGLAHEAARELVLFLRRPGGQPQVSVSLASQASEMASIRELQIWIAEHLGARLSVEDLADRMAMSVRNFERVFTREVGTTPSQYVLHLRVEAARRLLERTNGGPQADRLGGRLRRRRRDETRVRAPAGYHAASLSRRRGAVNRRLTLPETGMIAESCRIRRTWRVERP